MTKGSLKIHSENILPIIKQWLYSDKDIFLRELVSNSCDAISKLKILRDRGEATAQDEEFRIDITIDQENSHLIISDTGIGMTSEEVEKYIAQLAFSGAEDFLSKYTTEKSGEQVIGHFGLGFYSSFMVSDQVEIQTLSYQSGAKPAHWSCDGSSEYLLEEGSRSQRGTQIILHINEASKEYLEEAKIREILTKYCSFLPCPIYLGETRINDLEPLWIKAPSECTDKEYLDLYRKLHPMEPDPIFWIHLNVDYPFHLKGILYFPKITQRFDYNKSSIQLFCNRVFVSDQCRDLIPDFLTILRGAIDSPDIPLNVSRSYLQMDRTVRQLATHISKKVSDRLIQLKESDPERFQKLWPDIEMIVKLGVLQDDKFYERVKDCLIWKNHQDEWTNLKDYLERSKDQKKIFYSQDQKEHSPMLKMYTDKGVEVLFADSYIDTSLLSHLEMKMDGTTFQRIDGAIDDLILDKEREKTLLDAEGKTEAARIADFIRKSLNREEIAVEAKSLASDALPGFVMIDENSRRMREFFALSKQDMAQIPNRYTFVVNTNHTLINSLKKLEKKEPELAQEAVNQLFELALLSQRELQPDQLARFVNRSNLVMEKLSTLVSD